MSTRVRSVAFGEYPGTLQDAGYAGDYDIKLLGSEVETVDYWTLLEHSQLAFGELAPAPVQRSSRMTDSNDSSRQWPDSNSAPRDSFFIRPQLRSRGQNVNKVASKAVLRWSVAETGSLPFQVRGRLIAQCGRQINDRGELVLTSQRYRDQAKNIDDCLDKLRHWS